MKLKVILITLLSLGIFHSQQVNAQIVPLTAEAGVGTTNPNQFRLFATCEPPNTVPFFLDIDASTLCEFYFFEITISFSCDDGSFQGELESLGWNVVHGGPTGTTATLSVPGGSPGYSAPLNVPCGCDVLFSVAALPYPIDPAPYCENIGMGSITLSQF